MATKKSGKNLKKGKKIPGSKLQRRITGSAMLARAPLGRAPLGRAPLGRAPLGRAPLGRAPLGRSAGLGE